MHRVLWNRLNVVLPILLIWFVGCTPQAEIQFEDSNQLFLERTFEKIDLSNTMNELVPPGSSVCVVSMESDKTIDSPIVALVEDNLIEQLITSGYSVLERDDDLVRRIIQESSGENYQYTFFPGRIVVKGQTSSLFGNSWGYGVGGASSASLIEGAFADTVLVVPTNMSSAEYIVAYRILECGLVYRKADKPGIKKREAQVRLHVRIHDAKSGSIVLAKNFEARDEDLIDKESAKWLSNYHYTFFGADHPRYKGQEYGTRNIEGKKANEGTDSKNPQ